MQTKMKVKKLNTTQAMILRAMDRKTWSLSDIAGEVGMLHGPTARSLDAMINRGLVLGSSLAGYKRSPDGTVALREG